MEERSISPRTREGLSARSEAFEHEAQRLAAKHRPGPERQPPHCASCPFFVPCLAEPGMGECRHSSPGPGASGSRAAWPHVAAADFCGAHPDWPRP